MARQPVPTGSANPLTPEEMKALGIEGDTPRDTVATLVAQVKQLRNELQTALNDNKNQKSENERMRARESAIDQRIQSALDGERGRLQQDREQVAGDRQQTQGLLQDLQRRLDGLPAVGQADLPVGSGPGGRRRQGLRRQPGRRRARHKRHALGGTRRREALGEERQRRRPELPDELRAGAENAFRHDRQRGKHRRGRRQPRGGRVAKPVYTVPSNSTLMGSIAMTALIGRVPIDGTVNDPYPFKVLIGPDNLTANGIDIPDVAGAVVSGTASGDWTLSCVRGQIPLGPFVQRRHHPHHAGGRQPQPERRQRVGQAGEQHHARRPGLDQRPLWHPCVSGERRSNAQQYLGSQALITAAGAGAASLIKSDNGSVAVVANNNGSLGTVGISGNEAMGRILAGGVRDMADWVNKLYGQAFAAVYVRPGAKVAVHLEQPLNIDYDAKGRRVNHRIGRRPCVGSGLNRPRHCGGAVWCWAAARPARTSCCRTAITPCSTCGTRRRAAAPVADRRRGNCSTRARACAGR